VGPPGKPVPDNNFLCLSTPDLGFGENNIIYATAVADFSIAPPFAATNIGVWRAEVNFDDPTESEWVRIDDNQASTGTLRYDHAIVEPGSAPMAVPPSGVLYVVDARAVDTTADVPAMAGGLWRSTNPTADVDSSVPPYFEKENKGLTGNGGAGSDSVGFMSSDFFPTTIFCKNNTATNYWEQVELFTDILDVGVTLASPEADAVGVGLLPEGMVYPEVSLFWEEMAGAFSYQYELAIDPDFKTRIDLTQFNNGFTPSLASPPLTLHPNTTYYWRVRVANDLPTTLLGAPLISPWSAVQKFKTAIGASMARPRLEAPDNGEFDIPLSPTFEWSGIEWAEVYEYELGLSPTTTAGGYFAEPLVALVGTNSLVSTAWKCDTTLDYTTRYYWHVKAIGVDTDTPWSDVGTFTTMGVPPEPTEPGPDVIIPPVEQITPAWIWAIVIIGAILVIAVVVLIVTTRRVP